MVQDILIDIKVLLQWDVVVAKSKEYIKVKRCMVIEDMKLFQFKT
jgi:hypothetical protein